MEANFIIPRDQINYKAVYENINGHCNGSKYFNYNCIY